MHLLGELKDRFRVALQSIADDTDAALELIRPAQDSRFGDYQANCAMPLGKQLGTAPRNIANQIVERLDVSDFCDAPEIAGPGFINLRLQDQWLAHQLTSLESDERLGVPTATKPRTYIVDYSSPNVAKSMHVGHIRSTVIGDALSRILRFLGHKVVSDNHLGDWGTQFGMIIYGYRNFLDQAAYEAEPLAELGRVYKVVRALMDYHAAVEGQPAAEQRIMIAKQEMEAAQTAAPQDAKDKKARKSLKRAEQKLASAIRAQADQQAKIEAVKQDQTKQKTYDAHKTIQQAVLHETAQLHEGNPESLALWKEVLPKCRNEVQRIYDRLDISFDVELGESFYHDRLAGVVDDLTTKGMATESEGAICVFLDDFDAPMLIRKNDGAFLYATTDLATIQYRMEEWSPDAILYVVDFRQGEHFKKLFAVARNWGYDNVELQHVEFGTVLGDDGRPFKTRSGDTVGLESLLDAAVARAKQVVSDNDDAKRNGPELSAEQRDHIAHVIGHAAIKYADLSQNRASDYVFSEDKMVALKGNTATYLQYSYARAKNIMARAGFDPQASKPATPMTLDDPKERQLALALLRFPEACDEVLIDYRPNQLTTYVYDLATLFSEFYEACPVLKADTDEQRINRLRMCALVARTLKQTLSLLGIQVVEKM